MQTDPNRMSIEANLPFASDLQDREPWGALRHALWSTWAQVDVGQGGQFIGISLRLPSAYRMIVRRAQAVEVIMGEQGISSAGAVIDRLQAAAVSSPASLPTESGLQRRASFRLVETDWLSRNRHALSRYAGEWVVLEGQEIVAHDARYATARRTALDRGITTPFIFFVPNEVDENFMGI